MKILKRSFLVIACMVVSLFFAPLLVRDSNSYSAESGQIVVTRPSKIQVIEIDGGLTKDLAYPRGGDNPICLPNGKGIVFVRHVKYGRDEARELFLLEPQGKEPIQITFEMNVRLQFSAAPNGEQLAFVSNITKQVHVMQIDTRQSTQLTNIPGGVAQAGSQTLAWSPDSKRLALAFQRDSQHAYQASFYVLDTFTRRLVTVPTPPATAPLTWSPWSPDGTKLALGGMHRTIIVDLTSDQPRIVREFPGYVKDVHWSPDGTKLAFTQGQEGKYCDSIYVMELQNGTTRRVSPWLFERRCFHGPSWSPDSKMLAFLEYFSRGDMSLLPWPASITDQLYVADKDMSVRRITDDLKRIKHLRCQLVRHAFQEIVSSKRLCTMAIVAASEQLWLTIGLKGIFGPARCARGPRLLSLCVRCSDKMNKPGKIIPSGPFKGKRIELASTDELDMFRSLAEEFMEAIFCMEPGSYLITDESSLRDFKGVEELELPDMHRRIREVYGVDVSDIVSGNLVEVFARIHKHTYGQQR